MRQSPELAKVQQRMQPGELTVDGFLGDDTRPLANILLDDETKIRALGLTHALVASALQRLTDEARRGQGNRVVVDDRYEVEMTEVRGGIPSPWPGEGVFPKSFVRCHDRQTGHTLQWSDLSMHLIKEHGFYEGKGSPFRLDPEVLDKVLDVPEPDEELPEGPKEGE